MSKFIGLFCSDWIVRYYEETKTHIADVRFKNYKTSIVVTIAKAADLLSKGFTYNDGYVSVRAGFAAGMMGRFELVLKFTAPTGEQLNLIHTQPEDMKRIKGWYRDNPRNHRDLYAHTPVNEEQLKAKIQELDEWANLSQDARNVLR